MKTKFMILLIGILLVGGVVAGIGAISRINRTIDLDQPVRDILTARGFTDIVYEDYEIGDDQVKRTIYQQDVIQTFVLVDTYWMNCSEWKIIQEFNETSNQIDDIITNECLTEVRIDYTEQQIEDILDSAIANKLKSISEDTPTPNKTKVAEGDIVTRERR